MAPIRVFLASSSDAKEQAKALAEELATPNVTFVRWWKSFTPGRTLFDEMSAIRKRVDAALIVLTPEIQCEIQGRVANLPNQNVLFEFGYFYGRFKKKRVAAIKYGDVYLPSDLAGYVHIYGSRSFQKDEAMRVGKRTRRDFERWLAAAEFGVIEGLITSA